MLQRCMELKQRIVADALTPRRRDMMQTLIVQVEGWARERKIIPNSTPMAQLMKTMSELGELADATIKNDRSGIIDGVGDVLVTLIIYSQLQGLPIELCLKEAYEQIKDRKGVLTPEGVFVKEGDA